jgi:hypothetical protein
MDQVLFARGSITPAGLEGVVLAPRQLADLVHRAAEVSSVIQIPRLPMVHFCLRDVVIRIVVLGDVPYLL